MMRPSNSFLQSAMGQAVYKRLLPVCGVLLLLWLAVFWAIDLP